MITTNNKLVVLAREIGVEATKLGDRHYTVKGMAIAGKGDRQMTGREFESFLAGVAYGQGGVLKYTKETGYTIER